MIPLKLRISGFLSYRDPVEVDFSTFNLACISGHNGAGKSSLLDAITWALFGQARKRDDSLVNLQSEAAEVAFTFSYESNVYRAQRSLPRGKGTVLEFQIREPGTDLQVWRPLTERTIRETQARIEQTLRLDYETFVNASFFLQGKADQFTQQTASKRKEVLGNILGLEVWELYRERTANRRKGLESEIDNIEGRVTEIDNELAEEEQRKTRLAELEAELKRLVVARKTQETLVDRIKTETTLLENQRKTTDMLTAALERSQTHLSGLQTRLAAKETERASYTDLVNRATDVESAYQAWQAAREELSRLDGIAEQFRAQDARRQSLVKQIEVERAALEQEQKSLNEQHAAISGQLSAIRELEPQLEAAKLALGEAEKKLVEFEMLETHLSTVREKLAARKAENAGLKAQMDELKIRIDQLKAAEGAVCPVCRQTLTEKHRLSTLKHLEDEGKARGDRYRANQLEIAQFVQQIMDAEAQIAECASIDQQRLDATTLVTQLTERLETLKLLEQEWQSTGGQRLLELTQNLEQESFAQDVRKQLAGLDKKLAKLGYDISAHEKARQAEVQGRSAEEEFRKLEAARSALKPIEDEIANIQSEIENRESEIDSQQTELDQALAALAAAQASAPDVDTAMDELLRLQETENRLRQEEGAARQKVDVLDDLRARKADYAASREELQRQVARHKTLERAFGKNGVPALLIEQSLPQIETRANELLDRLSDGQMSIRFVTQAEYKDKKRDDLKETLDIQISDGAGVRDYEMYSGGEAFRVNFAVRLALSEVLAQRKGARLQTLVIDEGFGSQDIQGRQRLIEAINLVKGDFAKILVITHLDELKDAFPTRIEVEKTGRGSAVQVI